MQVSLSYQKEGVIKKFGEKDLDELCHDLIGKIDGIQLIVFKDRILNGQRGTIEGSKITFFADPI